MPSLHIFFYIFYDFNFLYKEAKGLQKSVDLLFDCWTEHAGTWQQELLTLEYRDA